MMFVIYSKTRFQPSNVCSCGVFAWQRCDLKIDYVCTNQNELFKNKTHNKIETENANAFENVSQLHKKQFEPICNLQIASNPNSDDILWF